MMEELRAKSTGELVGEVADDLRMLVRKELELARVELLDGLKAQLKGAGLIALAAVSSLPGLLFLVIALALWLPFSAPIGFAIVGGGLLLFTVVGILIGIRIMRSSRPGVGTAMGQVKEDVRWARGRLRR